jgi:hypothetical protein
MAGQPSFHGGMLPSAYPEVQAWPALQQLLREQVDMQFADIRVLLRLPEPALSPNVGCNFTAASMIANQISGASIWFFHTGFATVIQREETRRKLKMPISGKRFTGFVRAYYPRQPGEPTLETIANHLYDMRNILAHNLATTGRHRCCRTS